MKPGDLIESDHVRKAYTGMTMYSLTSDSYRWYYLNQQGRDEVTLIKIFDSHPNGPAVRKYTIPCLFGIKKGPLPEKDHFDLLKQKPPTHRSNTQIFLTLPLRE